MRPVLAGLLAVFFLLAAATAHAQVDSREAILLQNQILELKRDLQTLRDQIASGGSSLGSSRSSSSSSSVPSGDLTAALLDRVTRLEDAVRSLRGRIDEVDNARQRQGDDLAKQLADLNFKLDNASPGTGSPGASSGGTSPPPGTLRVPTTTGTGPGTLPPAGPPPGGSIRRTPELAIQEGNAALARRDYASAETAAREVLNTPKSPRAIDAQFLLAEALVGKRDYAAAAVAFDDSYNRSRTGPHAQDSLLGLANALSTLGEKRAACATLDKLKAEFPAPRPELRQPIIAARQQAACH